jgi:hypothetical protein
MNDNIVFEAKEIELSVMQFDSGFYLQIDDDVYKIKLMSSDNVYVISDDEPEEFLDFLKNKIDD